METDAVVGRLLDAIDSTGEAESTLVIFTSENGFAPYVGAKELEARGHFPSGPLRGYKGGAWEGGHRVPFIVRFPGVTRPGSVCDQLVHQADVMATMADIMGTKLPDTAGEDSVSLLPLLNASSPEAAQPVRRHAVSCSMSGTPAIRDGRWKLILGYGPGFTKQEAENGSMEAVDFQLYDLAADLGEQKNVADDHPARVPEMKAVYEKLVVDGRSTPGEPHRNDVGIVWDTSPRGQGRARGADVDPQDEFAGREQFTVGMERSGCRRALLRGKGLSDGQPREGEPDWHKWIAESLGGIAFRLRDRQLGFTM